MENNNSSNAGNNNQQDPKNFFLEKGKKILRWMLLVAIIILGGLYTLGHLEMRGVLPNYVSSETHHDRGWNHGVDAAKNASWWDRLWGDLDYLKKNTD